MTLPELDNEVTARKKAAILLIALGQQTTAEVMKYLSDFEIEEIAQAIAEVEVVTADQEDKVLEALHLQREPAVFTHDVDCAPVRVGVEGVLPPDADT